MEDSQQSILDFRKLKAISDYQFTPQVTDILFKEPDKISIIRSKNTGKIRYIYLDEELLLTLRPTNGLFTLSFLAAEIIIKHLPSPTLRTVVLSEISPFIRKGRNVFCKHVVEIDENLRANDEVIVVNQEDELLAIGRLHIAIPYIKAFQRGVAINVRKGKN